MSTEYSYTSALSTSANLDVTHTIKPFTLCTISDDTYHYFMQKAKLEKLYASRDQSAVDAALSALTDCAAGKGGNLLDLSIKAARVRCTVGEISDAMEKVHGRHVASPRMVSGAYAAEYGQREEIDEAMKKVQVCREEANRTVRQLHTGSAWHSCCIPELMFQQGHCSRLSLASFPGPTLD